MLSIQSGIVISFVIGYHHRLPMVCMLMREASEWCMKVVNQWPVRASDQVCGDSFPHQRPMDAMEMSAHVID